MNSLFSAKKIVLICSFSFTIMFYFIGGFDNITSIEIPSLALPEFGNPFEDNTSIGKINISPREGLSDMCKKAFNSGPNKWYFANCQ